jgi:hypothetical protein
MRDWNMDIIEMEYSQWKEPIRCLHIYIFSNECESLSTRTKMGCTQDLKSKLHQLNDKEYKANQKNKRETGLWKLIFYIIVPPYRNYHYDDIIQECRTGRGWNSRCEKALHFVFSMGLEFKIDRHVLDSNSNYFDPSIYQLVHRYADSKGLKLSDMFISHDLSFSNWSQINRKKTSANGYVRKEIKTRKKRTIRSQA